MERPETSVQNQNYQELIAEINMSEANHDFPEPQEQASRGRTTIFHQNVDRLSNKIERLNHCLSMLKPDIVVLTEHGLKQDTIFQTSLIGYSIVSAFGRNHHQKGGVAIFKHHKLANKFEVLNLDDYSTELICEMAAIKMEIEKKSFLYILGIYRPPSAPLGEALLLLENALDSIPTNTSRICIVGDLNIDGLVESREACTLRNLLATYDIERFNLPPTRVTNTTAASIDVVCTNLGHNSVSVDILSLFISDHTGQLISLQVIPQTKKTLKTRTRKFTQDNMAYFRYLVESYDWIRISQEGNADSAYSSFISSLVSLLDLSCPYTTSCNKTKKWWNNSKVYTQEVCQLRTSFIEANKRYLLTGQEIHKLAASERKKIYDNKLRSRRREISEGLIADSQNKARAIWNTINMERISQKQNQEVSWQLNIDGELINDANQIAQKFNLYFSTIADQTLKRNNISLSQVVEINVPAPVTFLTVLTPTTNEEVLSIIKNMKSSNSTGIDGISAKLLKQCEQAICLPLATIINKSFTEGIFPSKLKLSKTYPLLKQGSKDNMANYRPISLVPTVSKIVEKIVLARLINHLDENNLYPPSQHGFIAKRSTITALIELVEFVIDKLETGNTVSTTFLDLSKAFDCLNHQHIIMKLKALGIRDVALHWFKDYLYNRRQVVELRHTVQGYTKSVFSEPLEVTRGVPQGSVLGPVLFVLFVSDLPNYLREYCHQIMFADDTVLITANKVPEHLEVANFVAVSMAQEYCTNNDLVFNTSKTKQLNFGSNKNAVLTLPELEIVESTKHLGVVLDNNLSWNPHIDTLCHRLSSALFALRRVKATSTAAASKIAYHALFETHLRYGIVLWGGSSIHNLRRVLILQKQAIRIMESLQPRDSCRPVFKKSKILTVTAIYILETILHATRQILARHNNNHNYNTRNGLNFSLPAHRLSIFSKKPSYAGAKLYNLLPPVIKKCDPKQLKKKLKDWLLEGTIYTIEEFQIRAAEEATTQ